MSEQPADATDATIELEVLGAPPGFDVDDARRLAQLALAAAGIDSGHLAIAFVSAERMRELNCEHRAKDAPTDVLSFPIDSDRDVAGPRELGDVVVCPEHSGELREVVLHGVLHLAGMDHEVDDGEMLVVQRELLSW